MSAARLSLACLDMAGTTVRDEGTVEAAFLEALERAGVGPADPRLPAMLAYVHSTMGTAKIEVFRALLGDEEDAQRASRAFEDAYGARVDAGEVTAMPGAVTAVERLRAAGVKVAILTGFSAATRDRVVEALGWKGLADLLVCPSEAGRGRPYPDMVLTAVLRLGIDDVAEVAVVGDTAADIASGKRAGAALLVGVLSGTDDATRLLDAGATHLLDDVGGLPSLAGIR